MAGGAGAASLAAVLLVAGLYPGLRFTSAAPVSSSASSPTASASARPAFTAAKDSPAQTVLTRLLAPTPGGLPDGFSPASSISGTVSPAVSPTCDSPVAPVLSRSRSFAAGGAPVGSGLTVTVSAYSAGAGAPAMDAMRTARSECVRGASVTQRTGSGAGSGVQALDAVEQRGRATIRSVLLRRGDVIVSVTGSAVAVPDGLLADLDGRLAALLQGVCLKQDATTTDFTRSVLAGVQRYTGLLQDQSVPLPTSAAALPALVSPSATPELPEPVSATPPQFPFWPTQTPVPVKRPTAPAAPTPYPTATGNQVPIEDPDGPGCGWAFTGMLAPAFDPKAAAAIEQQRRTDAIAAMGADVAAYPAKAQAYAQSFAQFDAQAKAYLAYVDAMGQIESQWAVQRAQQQAYADALIAYQQATQAYQQQLTERAAAQQRYEQAVQWCAQYPQGYPPPTTPAPPSPDTATPTDPNAQPTPNPTGSTATPVAPVAPPPSGVPATCPPQPDPLLAQPAPTSPASPAPPPDPRPTP